MQIIEFVAIPAYKSEFLYNFHKTDSELTNRSTAAYNSQLSVP